MSEMRDYLTLKVQFSYIEKIYNILLNSQKKLSSEEFINNNNIFNNHSLENLFQEYHILLLKYIRELLQLKFVIYNNKILYFYIIDEQIIFDLDILKLNDKNYVYSFYKSIVNINRYINDFNIIINKAVKLIIDKKIILNNIIIS